MSDQSSESPESGFEQALAELEAVVERMESNELPLEESLAQFERGVNLARQCQQALKNAEQRVEQLTSGTGGDRLEPFENGE